MDQDIPRLMTEVRLAAGLSQSELAVLMCTQQPSIARMESGRTKPSYATLEKLAEVTGRKLEIRFI